MSKIALFGCAFALAAAMCVQEPQLIASDDTKHHSTYSHEVYDFVIVGAGNAICQTQVRRSQKIFSQRTTTKY